MVDHREQCGNVTTSDSPSQSREEHEGTSIVEETAQDEIKINEENKRTLSRGRIEQQERTEDGDDSQESEDNNEPSAEQHSPEEATEAHARILLERRRRRCPMVNIDQYSEGESKNDEGRQMSVASMIMQGNIAGLIHRLRDSEIVSEADAHGWTPLHWACSRGNVVVVHILLQEIRAAKAEGCLRLVATSAGDGVDGTDVDPTDFLNAAEGVNGWTPLHLAAVGEYLDVVYLLMDAGCNPNVKDKVGDRPIDCVRRATAQQGKRARRLRNALCDLSDSASSDDGENIASSRQKERRDKVVDSKAHRRKSESGHARLRQRNK